MSCRTALFLMLAAVPLLRAAELKPETAAAFDRYIRLTEAEMQTRSPQDFLWIDRHRKEKTMVWLSQDVIEPRETLDQGQKIDVPDGAIQHWYAAIYLETGTLERVRDMLLGYAGYKNFFKQQVLDSRLVKRDGDNFDAFLRLSKKQVTQVVLNVDLSSKYTTVDPMRATIASHSTRIGEAQHPGKKKTYDQELPAVDQNGYLWRLNMYWRFEVSDVGVYAELELISLARPTGTLHPGPIVERFSDLSARVSGRVPGRTPPRVSCAAQVSAVYVTDMVHRIRVEATRRSFLTAALGAAALTPAAAQNAPQRPAVSPDATPRDWSGAQPVRYPDPDIVALDNRFRRYMVANTVIKRHYTGTLWAEGPAWNGAGRYLVWSDIPNNVQMRWIEEDGHVSVFRNPSGYSNGNTFDYEGRELSCEHGGRRVVRYEPNGTVTVIADKFDGKRLNSPNDIAVHPDGSIWFTDPTYGITGNYEGFKADKELKEAVYRVDSKTGQMDKIYDEMNGPNGICFSPDYKKVYVADTGTGREIRVWDVDGKTVRNGKRFIQLDVPGSGAPAAADGIRCDADGNIWAGARPGVQIITSGGDRIGMIRLPENCANICFGGTKRNRLFMAASQSLYSVYVLTTGAHIA